MYSSGGKQNHRNRPFATPPLHTRHSMTSSSVPGGGGATSSCVAGGGAMEETMSLIREKPLEFGMIVRMTPDLIEEINRAQQKGDSHARIRFDTYPNNPAANVIDVGGKDFKFTWSSEPGYLCDIYEERQSGEDGERLLVESGGAWRKLNVQRVLDESTKNHVKKRSEEAERKQRSRKAIVLDSKNPATKNQMKALAASESTTTWRKSTYQKKEPEFKKRKTDPPPVSIGGSAKYKSGRPSISPSPPQYSGAPVSPFATGSMTKGHTSAEDLLSNQAMMKEHATFSEKEKFNKPPSRVQEKFGRKGNLFAKSLDLQSTLITLLTENPKGMSLKALEKAVGDSVPNSIKKIEPIIKRIATYQAPGRYILKPGVELGNLKKPLSESGSSPEINGHQAPIVEEKHEDTSTPKPNISQRTSATDLEKQALSNRNIGQEMNSFDNVDIDNVDIERNSPDHFGEKKISDNNEGPARSSSSSGSDSDSESDSSDSGSEGGRKSRRSKSKSPVKSGSASSSDSESDASSNSKQGPDEDVDIMTSDDEESKPNTHISEAKFTISPISFADFDEAPTQNGLEEKQDNGSDIEIEQDGPDDVHQTVVDSDRELQLGYMFSERENVGNDVSKHDRSRIPERTSNSKSKRGSDSRPPHEKSGHSKRSKHGNLSQPHLSHPRDHILSESPQTMPIDRVVLEPYKGRSSQMTNRALKDGSADSEYRKDNLELSGKSSIANHNSGRKSADLGGRTRTSDTEERSHILPESLDFGMNRSGKDSRSQERLSFQTDKVNTNSKDDKGYNKEKLRNSMESSLVEKTPSVLGRGKMLQRELSELELGEFREPLPGEIGSDKRLERKNSLKETENAPSSSDYWNSDFSKGRPTFRPEVLSNVDPPKKTSENQPAADIARPPNTVLPFQPKGSLHTSRADRAELTNRKPGDTSGKIRHNVARENLENGVGWLGDHVNGSVSASKQMDVERGPVSHPKRESKTQKMNSLPDPGEVKKDASLTESSEGVIRRRESSSDENSCSFSKYEKEEPELKGPIKDYSQYKEYVQEYLEKFDSYCTLNKTLETYRNEFCKLGKDLESAKGKDQEKYSQILRQLNDSYHQYGNRHKRLKKIFVVLHEELKYLKQAIKDYAAAFGRE